ncbi:MAG TPA: hypothetical protein VFR84_17535 [Candidatus Angelobacter sp.]|nr:hypothetical protein [Candidatus Angelobacter sp.]
MFRPRGMVRATVHLPGGGEITDYWVSDGASGFCRIDQLPDPANPGLTHGVLNLSTCYLPAVFEPTDLQAETRGVNGSNGYVFVGGIKEVTRLEFMPSPTEPGRTVINTATQISIFSTASVFPNGAPALGPRFVQSTRMGPDGKLYICFQGSGDIWRIRNPLSPTFTPLGNAVERVGTSDNGKTLLSMGWIGHDLWMQQAGFLNRLQNADKCNYTLPACVAVLEFGKLQTQEGMATDQYISSSLTGRWLYWGNGNRVVRYDTLSADIMQQWNQSGFVNGSVIPQQYTLIMGLNFIQPQHPTPGDPQQDLFTLADGSQVADMTITMDKIIEAPPPAVAGPIVRTGVTYMLKSHATMVPEPCLSTPPNPPPCVNSQIGNDSPPQNSPTAIAARRAVLLLAGVTHPRGLLFLGTKWWVSDEDNGFCRIDQNPVTGAATMAACFKPSPGFIPGQPAADAPSVTGTQNVYIPDVSGTAKGIVRAVFTPSAAGGTLSETGLLNSGPGTAAAVAIPNGPFNDGAIYIGYIDNGRINKIQQPATAPTAPIAVGGVGNGVGVLSLTFMGNDLYLAELGPPANAAGQLIKGGQITVLQAASPDLQRGGARVVTKPISRLQSPTLNTTPQLFVNPGAIVVGPSYDRPACLPPLGVALSIRVPKDPTTTPTLFFGSYGVNPTDAGTSPAQPPEVDSFDSVCTTEIPWVLEGALDPARSLNVPLSAITALGVSSYSDPLGQLAIGDDPNTIPEAATLQRSKITPPATGPIHGQGHVYIVP